MATNLTVESADKSARWYITPGNSSTYDLSVHNDTDRAVLCRVTLDSHADTGTVKPQSLTLQARETRNVAVTFGPEARLPRDRKAVITIKDAAGKVLSTTKRELVSGSSTDATVDLSWKAPIVEDDKLCGFVLLCAIRSLSGAADDFTPEFGAHPALIFPVLSPIRLEPGATANLILPIRWNRVVRDAEGWNHPRAIEASVAVSQGRRSGRLSWDVVQRSIAELLDRSDRSPVVERKAAASGFGSGSVVSAGNGAVPNDVKAPVSPPIDDAKPAADPAASSQNGAHQKQATPPTSAPSPKKARSVDEDLAINFDGYRPAFQLVKDPRASQPIAQVFGDPIVVVPPDPAIKVDDLDSSIVGSGLNYSRNGNGAVPAAQPAWRRVPGFAWVAAIAVVAVLGFTVSRMNSPSAHSTVVVTDASPSASAAVSVPSATAAARINRPNRVAARKAPKRKIAPPSPKAAAQTPAATTPPVLHAKPLPVRVATAAHRTPARQTAARPAPINRSALPEIASVDASYASQGHAVRVAWESTSQASASVQLTNARGTLIAQSAVRGGRSRLLLGLPRGYHGGVYIQVSVTGYHSERVVQTSSLDPY